MAPSTRRTRSAVAAEDDIQVSEPIIITPEETQVTKQSNDKKTKSKSKAVENIVEDDDDFDIKALVKQASSRFTQLSTSGSAVSQESKDGISVAKALALSTNGAAVNPSSRFFVPSSNGLISIDGKAADVRGCESTSVYLSKSVISSTMNNPLAEVEKDVDLVDELISSTSAKIPSKIVEIKKDTAGKGWYDLPATPLTEELKMDFRLLRNKGALDPKKFYKQETGHKFPKYFQVGTMIHGATGFLNDRIAKRDRRDTIVQEILGDQQIKSYLKRKMNEVQAAAPKRRKFSGKNSGKNDKKRR